MLLYFCINLCFHNSMYLNLFSFASVILYNRVCACNNHNGFDLTLTCECALSIFWIINHNMQTTWHSMWQSCVRHLHTTNTRKTHLIFYYLHTKNKVSFCYDVIVNKLWRKLSLALKYCQCNQQIVVNMRLQVLINCDNYG